MLRLHHEYQNPILTVFARTLWRKIKTQRVKAAVEEAKRESEEGDDVESKGAGDTPVVIATKGSSEAIETGEQPKEKVKLTLRQVSFRFWLAVTLRNNPQLSLLRKQTVDMNTYLLERQLVDDTPNLSSASRMIDAKRKEEHALLRQEVELSKSSLAVAGDDPRRNAMLVLLLILVY